MANWSGWMCDCPDNLIMAWFDAEGETVEAFELTDERDGRREAERFNDHPTAVGWDIFCPTCRRLYAAGLEK